MSKPTANEDDPRAQHAAVGAWDNYVDPHPNGDKPRPRDSPATACPAVTPPPPQRCGNNTTEDDEVGPRAQHITGRRAGKLRQPAYRRRRATAEGRPRRPPPRRHRTPVPAPAPTTTSCAGSQISCRKRTAPPPSRCSKDVTAHPHQPRGRPGRPCPAPVRSGRHRPAKAGSNPHYRNRTHGCTIRSRPTACPRAYRW